MKEIWHILELYGKLYLVIDMKKYIIIITLFSIACSTVFIGEDIIKVDTVGIDTVGVDTLGIDTVVVDTISPQNLAPEAFAGVDQEITLPVNNIELSGEKSTDKDGYIVSYLWEFITGPAGFEISSPNSSKTTVSNLDVGEYMFSLEVTDDGGKSDIDTVRVIVNNSVVIAETYFEGNMDNVTVSPSGSSSFKFNGWPLLYGNSMVNDIYLNNLAAPQYAYQEIVQDPAGSGRKVMMGRIIGADPTQGATSRAQMTISYKSTTNLGVYHSSHRMYIHPDLKYIEQYPGVADWFSLFEIWNAHDMNMDGDVAGSARWGLSLHKDKAVGSSLYWVLYGQYMQPASMKYVKFWEYTNKGVVIPFSEWFTLDIYMLRGEGVNGKMVVTMTFDGGLPVTLFDISGTTKYPGRDDLHLEDWQPFKLYIGKDWMDWMNNNNRYMAIYYNDYKWYKN